MQKNISELYKKLLVIKKKGWIRSLRDGPTGIGYTFECLLNKPEENLPIPDFNGIEIKTIHKFSKRTVHLFNATPDGDYLFPIKRLLGIMGYPDKDFPDVNILNTSVNTKEYTNIGYYKKIKLNVNYKEKKVFLTGIKNNKNIDLNTSWSFKLLRERLEMKLSYLCIVEAESKEIDSCEYFNYNRINFYKLRNFNHFINLIDKGVIKVTFKNGVFKTGKRAGQSHDRGTDFSIELNNLSLLYKKI